jgi:hypothetical protein
LLILVAFSVLILVPLTMSVIELFRPNFPFQWPLALLGGVAAWFLVLFSKTKEPQVIPLLSWQPEALFPASPELLADPISWVYALALLTLCVAVLLTAVVRRPQAGWRSWAGTLILAGFGLFAVFAGNLVTLMMSWAALDLFEAWILFSWIRRSEVRIRFLIALSTRVFGIALLIGAGIITRANGEVLSFTSVPSSASILLLMAAALRLGVLPLQAPFLQDHPLRRGLGTPLRLVPAAASLVLLARAAGAQIPDAFALFLLFFAGLAAVYSAVSWMGASSELSGRPYWILGMASLAVAAAVRMQPGASVAWGIASILSGGALFMYSIRSKRLIPIILLGTLALTAFPFTPTWAGSAMYQLNLNEPTFYFDIVINLVLLFSQLALVFGYIRHALRVVETPSGLERWVWIFFPLGLGFLILAEYFLGWQIWLKWIQNPGNLWWVGGIVLITSVSLWFFLYKQKSLQPLRRFSKGMATWSTSFWGKLLGLQWFYRFVWILYHFLSRIISWFTEILEGDGGILWALVFLFLLFSLTLRGG